VSCVAPRIHQPKLMLQVTSTFVQGNQIHHQDPQLRILISTHQWSGVSANMDK
jgi:hypothetical protein